jgi:hypothetical protein
MHSLCIDANDSLDPDLLPEWYFHDGLAHEPEETDTVGKASLLSGASKSGADYPAGYRLQSTSS